MVDIKRSFDIEKIHPNENINFFINISNGSQLVAPNNEKEWKSTMKELLKNISIKLYRGDIPLFHLEDEQVKNLLLNTKNSEHYEKMAFEKMFIDITQEFKPGRGLKGEYGGGKIFEELSEKEKKCYGYYEGPKVTKCIMRGLYIDNNSVDKIIGITAPIEIVFRLKNGEQYSMNSMWDSNIGSTIEKHGKDIIDDDSKKQIKEFICNILDFMNHPDVEIICNETHGRNDLRIRRGKTPLPSKYSLVLKGKLRRYINKTISNNEKAWEIGHRFWVRGHWVEFKHKRYKNKQGQKTWILPFIKGKGELIKKDYYIGEKEQCWENEKQMIKIIRELYPGYEINTHDRTTLNGLEIDCYIPELKLGFEYNGKQHYEHIEIFHKTIEDFEKQKERDIEKMKRAKEKDIKIIIIRYDEAVIKEVIEGKL